MRPVISLYTAHEGKRKTKQKTRRDGMRRKKILSGMLVLSMVMSTGSYAAPLAVQAAGKAQFPAHSGGRNASVCQKLIDLFYNIHNITLHILYEVEKIRQLSI